MAYTTIDDPSAYFQTKIYTGSDNGALTQVVTNDGNSDLQPDWIWIKRRNSAANHSITDTVRGLTIGLSTSTTAAEVNDDFGVTAVGSDSFSVRENTSAQGQVNTGTLVAWQWKAGGSASSNSDGSITSSVSANTTAGFSIVSYTGNGSSATVGHGLGVAPNVIITKKTNTAAQWNFQNSMRGYSEYMALNTDEASQATGGAIISSVSSTTYSCDSNTVVNASSDTYISYCFAEKKGYSKFGTYTGNGSTNGTFVYTGFKPAWVMLKLTSANNENWAIMDNKRDPFNSTTKQRLRANTNAAEGASGSEIHLLSNGFTIHDSDAEVNGSGNSYIYMAFAESPFVTSTGIPTTAR